MARATEAVKKIAKIDNLYMINLKIIKFYESSHQSPHSYTHWTRLRIPATYKPHNK